MLYTGSFVLCGVPSTPVFMPTVYYLLLAGALAASWPYLPAAAQTPAPVAGRLRYEIAQRVNQNTVKITMFDPNGQEIKTDGPGSTIELPTSLSAEKSLLYSGAYAKEESAQGFQMAGGNISVTPDKTARSPARNVTAPLAEAQYLDLATRTATTVTTVTAINTEYISPAVPIPTPPAGWQDLPQTKRIAGYLCHKATVPFKKETYTLWVTTELPFSYSPVRELTPAHGVVLALSSDQEAYTATKLTPEPVPETAVRPSPQAQPITEAALKELRAKAQADQRQRLMEQYSGGAGK
jgi:GLPGLI family protein